MLLGIAILTLGALVAGCGQQTPEVKTTTNQPNGLVIRGVVRGTTLAGNIGDPISGAVVQLGAAGAVAAGITAKTVAPPTTTNANGEYIFSGIPDGQYMLIVTAEGYTRSTIIPTWPKSSTVVPADNTITVRDIQLLSEPIILSYSPVPGTVITNTQPIVVTFNEVMDTTTVAFRLAPFAVRTLVADATTVPLTVAWDSATAPKVATLTPKAALISNESYVLTVDPTSVAQDKAGYLLSGGTGAEQAQALAVLYKVSTGGVPGDPTDLTISYTNAGPVLTTEASYGNTFNTTGLGLGWASPTTGGPVTGYKVYVAYGASGNFTLLATVTPLTGSVSNQITMRTDGVGFGNDIITQLYGTGAQKDPVCTGGVPFINDICRFKVVAYNGDGESANGATISGRDSVGATFGGGTSWATFNTDAIMANLRKISGLTTSTEAYLGFNEPLSAIASAGKIHIGTYEATTATVIMNDSLGLGGGNLSMVKVTTAGPVFPGDGVTLEAGAVTDLSGNNNIADPAGGPLL